MESQTKKGRSRYRRLWYSMTFVFSVVSLAPLVVMTGINYQQYLRVFQEEALQPVHRLALSAKTSLEFFIAERESALTLIIHERSFEELADPVMLDRSFASLKKSFGAFVDLGLIDSTGNQRSYVGPYELAGADYREDDWFHEVRLRGIHVSDVFLGHRKFPHFVIAVMRERGQGDFYVLRATVDTEALEQQIRSLNLSPSGDAFLINDEGILQTASRFHGELLARSSLDVPPYSKEPRVVEGYDDEHGLVVGYAYIEQSPFILMVAREPKDLMRNWFALQSELIWVLAISAGVILIAVLMCVTYLVNRIRESDLRRGQVLHNAEYTSKMATIGRLAAGVAHEINNPLAIINEKAGLLMDLCALPDGLSRVEDYPKHLVSIMKSVERCSAITHRLLGFAKRMDIATEAIDLRLLIGEVLTFIEREATYRNVTINVEAPEDLPPIESDRGQLQQVFLNIVNNAVDAVEDGGTIDISIAEEAGDTVEVTIKDNGQGISENDIKHIFDPFFTTKKEYGTGLGLSITYGIVQRLGGTISAHNNPDGGACFSVRLPTATRS